MHDAEVTLLAVDGKWKKDLVWIRKWKSEKLAIPSCCIV